MINNKLMDATVITPRLQQKRPAAFYAHGSAFEAYREGFKCGRSPSGEADENPHKHRLCKKRKAWHQGWMDGGAIYLNNMNTIYIFHRADGWYPLELKDDAEAKANAQCNPGTLKVENAATGQVIWMPEDSQ